MLIHNLVKNGELEQLKVIQQCFTGRLRTMRFNDGVSLLHVAVGYNQMETTLFLLDTVQIDPLIQTNAGETVLHFKCSPSMCTFLCTRYPLLLTKTDRDGNTPFDIICHVGDEVAIRTMLPIVVLSDIDWERALLKFIPKASMNFKLDASTPWNENIIQAMHDRQQIKDPVIFRQHIYSYIRGNEGNPTTVNELLRILHIYRMEHGSLFRASFDYYNIRKQHLPLFPYLLEWFIAVEKIPLHPDGGFNLFRAFREATLLVPYTREFVKSIVDKADVVDCHQEFLDEVFRKRLYSDNALVDGLMQKSSQTRNWIGARVLDQCMGNKKIREGLRDWNTFTSYYQASLEFLRIPTPGSHMLPLDRMIEAHASWALIKQVCKDGGLPVNKKLYTSSKKRHVRTLTMVYKFQVNMLFLLQRKLPVELVQKLNAFYDLTI